VIHVHQFWNNSISASFLSVVLLWNLNLDFPKWICLGLNNKYPFHVHSTLWYTMISTKWWVWVKIFCYKTFNEERYTHLGKIKTHSTMADKLIKSVTNAELHFIKWEKPVIYVTDHEQTSVNYKKLSMMNMIHPFKQKMLVLQKLFTKYYSSLQATKESSIKKQQQFQEKKYPNKKFQNITNIVK
jgi:hypothetical protein